MGRANGKHSYYLYVEYQFVYNFCMSSELLILVHILPVEWMCYRFFNGPRCTPPPSPPPFYFLPFARPLLCVEKEIKRRSIIIITSKGKNYTIFLWWSRCFSFINLVALLLICGWECCGPADTEPHKMRIHFCALVLVFFIKYASHSYSTAEYTQFLAAEKNSLLQ